MCLFYSLYCFTYFILYLDFFSHPVYTCTATLPLWQITDYLNLSCIFKYHNQVENTLQTHLGQLAPHADAPVGHFTRQDEEQVVWSQTQDARLRQLGDGGDDSWRGRCFNAENRSDLLVKWKSTTHPIFMLISKKTEVLRAQMFCYYSV